MELSELHTLAGAVDIEVKRVDDCWQIVVNGEAVTDGHGQPMYFDDEWDAAEALDAAGVNVFPR